MKKSKATVVVDNKNRILVDVACIMHPLIPYIDGLEITQFEKDKRTFIEINEAIDWVKKELHVASPKERYSEILTALEKAKADASKQIVEGFL